MLYNLKCPDDRVKFAHTTQDFLNKGEYVELKKKNAQRTLQQNKYLHLLLKYYASELGYSLGEVKYDIFKNTVNAEIFRATRLNRRGEEVQYLRSISELDKAEMALAIERFRNYSSTVNAFYLPAPDDYPAIFAAQKQVEGYQEFL